MRKNPQKRAELKGNVERYLRQEEGVATKQAYLNAMTASSTKHHNSHRTTRKPRAVAETSDEESAHKDDLGHSKEMKEEADG